MACRRECGRRSPMAGRIRIPGKGQVMNEFELEAVDLSPEAVSRHLARAHRARAMMLRRGIGALLRAMDGGTPRLTMERARMAGLNA